VFFRGHLLNVDRFMARLIVVMSFASLLSASLAHAETTSANLSTERGGRMIAAYFENETRALAEACLADVKTRDDWQSRRDTYRGQLREMLGLDPLPERTPLQAVVTGKLEHDDFTVEKLHFQSRPRLYVTANLYLPKNQTGPVPAILYLCGHSKAVQYGVSLGNKTQFQHHGAWFARNGYACLVIDTLQLGEIEGVHHGTYRENMWWWNARGYTPAGVETWNSIRALDYLETRPEVDKERLGVTGRSGGGAYSWYVAALDDRVKCVVPVAGITTLKNHVVDGCVEGHCDCMYMVNTYRWDYPQLAALTAPRPLLIANSDQDDIFPLDGVMEVHRQVQHVYTLGDKRNLLGLNITVGPHDDTQMLQLHAFQWFNHHMKRDNSVIRDVAEPYFELEQLKVFDTLPTDQINSRVYEEFVPLASEPTVPSSKEEWQAQTKKWKAALRAKCFAGWPEEEGLAPPKPTLAFEVEAHDTRFLAYDFESQHDIELRLFLLLPANSEPEKLHDIVLSVMDRHGWDNMCSSLPPEFAAKLDKPTTPSNERIWPLAQKVLADGEAIAYIAPRGIGPTAWNDDPKNQTHVRRRFMLLGQTLEGMRVWDARRAIQALAAIEGLEDVPVALMGMNEMEGIALYAALFEDRVTQLDLKDLSHTHRDGPDFLNVLRILDVPQTVAMVAERAHVWIRDDKDEWQYPIAVAKKFGSDNLLVDKAIDATE
jgi:cephalosporin-C deacetylase-like acetyl esterase